MLSIDDQSNNNPVAVSQSNDDGLGQLNPSTTDDIVRRGQEALQRLRRSYEDWLLIAEALQVGRTESMRAAHTNEPKGRRFEKAMADWLFARSFHLIDKGTRKRLLDCLQHRTEIEKWRATLTDGGRFRFNHPDAVLRKWRAATEVPNPNALKKPSPVARYKEWLARLEEENYRMRREIERGGGDLWNRDDRPEDIARVLLEQLSVYKVEKVARAILSKVKEKKKAAQPKSVPSSTVEIGGAA